MINNQPYYRLRELILKKYGKDRFDFGCMIVSMFLNHGNIDLWTVENIKQLCETQTDEYFVSVADLHKLRSLFKLQSISLLYTPLSTAENKSIE